MEPREICIAILFAIFGFVLGMMVINLAKKQENVQTVENTESDATSTDATETDVKPEIRETPDYIVSMVENYKKEAEERELERQQYWADKEAKEKAEKEAAAAKKAQKKAKKQTVVTTQPADSGGKLTAAKGVNYGPSGKETYYNLPMGGVINIAQSQGIQGEYWVREDGCKMYGDYIIVAANLNTHPRGTTVETSLGTGIVLDTGGFAANDPYQVDIAVTW